MHHNTHERRPGDFNGKDRGCSRGAVVVVTTAGQLSRNTGKWTQKPLVRLFEPQRAYPPMLTTHKTAQECLRERGQKGNRRNQRQRILPPTQRTVALRRAHRIQGTRQRGGGDYGRIHTISKLAYILNLNPVHCSCFNAHLYPPPLMHC